MAEYIERTEELILAVNAGARVIENTKRYHGASYCIDMFAGDHKEIPYLKAAEVLRGLDEIPAADVAPVVHGRWRPRPMIVNTTRLEVWMCSVCGVEKTRTSIYCPNCGAKMKDGDVNEG